MRILVYAYRNWSFFNLAPALREFEYVRWWQEKGDLIDWRDFDLIITCEPHIDGWREFYKTIKGKKPILALQQSLFWTDEKNIYAKSDSWKFDRIMLWGQMQQEMCLMHDLSEDRMIITGNPRFDKYFRMKFKTENKRYTLVLCGSREVRNNFPIIFKDAIFRLHPVMNDHKIVKESLDEQIRCADRIVFRLTGVGIIAMIMEKPVMIMNLDRVNRHNKTQGHLRYVPSKLYGKNYFGCDFEYVKYAITDFGAIKKVQDEIQRFSNTSRN